MKRKKQFLFERFHSLNRGKRETKKPNLSAVLIEFLSSKQTKFTKVYSFSRQRARRKRKLSKPCFFLFLSMKRGKKQWKPYFADQSISLKEISYGCICCFRVHFWWIRKHFFLFILLRKRKKMFSQKECFFFSKK